MAAQRSITVTLRANVQDFKSQFDAATKAAEQAAKGVEGAAKQADTSMGRMVQSARDNREAWTTAGATLTGFGAAVLGGLGLATKAAMDWESSWAGVQKTVDGTAPQMAALEAGLRGLARELPASHTEIAAVAEAAGQLGIATPNILGFTRTMIDMGEATNLSADEAATALARFITVTGTSQNDIGRLGATVVGLGNNFATTESEIVMLSQRLAAAGTQAGMSEGEIMGMATAMSQVGIEAEAGGSAMTQSLNRMSKAVEEGGESLDLFAAVSGMTADQFTAAWENDPAQALVAFTEGLADTSALGMSTNAVLTELGITGLREADVMRRLALATGTMSDAMAMGNAEFESGTALIEEASKRYETAESRIAMARNALVDAGISIGSVVLPAFANLADGVASIAGWFADLPGPVHATAAGLAGVAGAASLGAGAFLLVAPRVLDTVSAFRDLGAISPGTASKVGRLTLGVGKLGLGVAALAAVPPVLNAVTDAMRGIDNAEFDLGMNELTSGLLEAERSGKVFDNVLGDMYESGALNKQMFSDLGGTITEVSNINWFQNLIGPLAATGINDAKDRLEGLSDAFTLLAQTDLEKATATFSAFIAEAEAGGATFAEVMDVMPGFRDHLVGVAEAMGVGTDDATLYKIATGELSPVVDEATGAVTGFAEGMEGAADATQSAADAAGEALSAMADLANEFINAERGALDYADAMEEAGKAAAENGKHWEDGTQKADENKRSLLDLADQAWATADAFSADNKSGTFLKQAREDLIDTAIQMGASREEAEAYADQLLGTPAKIQTQIDLDTAAAQEKWDTIFSELWPEGGHPPMVIDPEVDPEGKVPAFTGVLDTIPPEVDTTVNADTDEATGRVWGFGDVLEQETADKTTTVTADVEPAIWEVNRFNAEVDAAGGTVTINGDALPADQALATIMGIINSSDGTVTIDGMTVPADQALGMIIGKINTSDGTVTIEGNNAPANAATDRAKRKADGTTGTIDVNANTGGAESSINSTARDRSSTITANASTWSAENQLNWLARNRTSTITVRTSGAGGGVNAQLAYASGGAVYGPGTGTSDSVPARLSNGEHVITAREVAMAGGQDAIYRMREAIRSGAKFANGGAVERRGYAPAPALAPAAQFAGQSRGVVIESLTVQPQVMAEMDPTVYGRRFSEAFTETMKGASFGV